MNIFFEFIENFITNLILLFLLFTAIYYIVFKAVKDSLKQVIWEFKDENGKIIENVFLTFRNK